MSNCCITNCQCGSSTTIINLHPRGHALTPFPVPPPFVANPYATNKFKLVEMSREDTHTHKVSKAVLFAPAPSPPQQPPPSQVVPAPIAKVNTDATTTTTTTTTSTAKTNNFDPVGMTHPK